MRRLNSSTPFAMKKRFARVLLGLSIILTVAATAADRPATPPGWWEQYGITLGSSDELGTHLNYAKNNRLITIGQLKEWATGARDYLDNTLVTDGGAGQAVSDAVAALDDSDPSLSASVAQFQNVMQPIYDRLMATGFDTKANLQAHGAGAEWASAYPWAQAPARPDDPAFDADAYAAWQAQQAVPANLGQAQLALSFDLSDFTTKTDLPGNGSGLGGKHNFGAGTDRDNANETGDETSAKHRASAASATALASAEADEANTTPAALALVVLTPLE
jgi:hypothetical protein